MENRTWKSFLIYFIHPGRFFLRRDFPVFLFCLFISAALWLIIRFSQPYEQVINIPLKYTGVGKKLALVSYSDSVLRIKATLRGIQIVSFRYIHQPEAYKIDVSTLRTRPINALQHKAFLPVDQLLTDIAQQMGIKGQVSIVDPDTLFFVLEKRATRRLPVRPDISYQIPQGMMIADSLRIKPAWVEVTGPISVLDTLRYITTTSANLGSLSSDRTVQLGLKKPVAYLPFVIEPERVEVTLTIDKFTEAVAEVPLSLPDSAGCRLKLIPEKVKLHLVMPLRRYRDFDPASCMVGVNCPPADAQGISTLPVQIVKMPSFVRCLEIEPPSVEFLILD